MHCSMENLRPIPFNGRLIFDHLQKTAGQALNAWLRNVLGEGNVTDNLICSHRLAIKRYGGDCSVISGHMIFDDDRGLDRRYQYITCLREPIDRDVSWLYFLVNNHDPALGGLHGEARAFLQSEGSELGLALQDTILDFYVNHFCDVAGSRRGSDDERLERAVNAALLYDEVGFYEDLPAFTAAVARLLGAEPPATLQRTNVTVDRRDLKDMPIRTLAKLAELSELDLRFFQRMQALMPEHQAVLAVARQRWDQTPVKPWQPVALHTRRLQLDPRASINSAAIMGPTQLKVGTPLSVRVDICLNTPVEVLEVGVHVYDADLRWAFGTNSVLLGQRFPPLGIGGHTFIFTFLADLPLGTFTAGFSLADKNCGDGSSFVWHDELIKFEVVGDGRADYAGYRRLPAAIQLVQKTTSRAHPSTALNNASPS